MTVAITVRRNPKEPDLLAAFFDRSFEQQCILLLLCMDRDIAPGGDGGSHILDPRTGSQTHHHRTDLWSGDG